MKRYRVYDVELTRSYSSSMVDSDQTEVVKASDYDVLEKAIDLHQRQFMRVCLERDQWQRKVFELQREVDRINFIASEGWGTSGETRALEQIHKLTTPLLVQRVKGMGKK